MSKIVQVLHYEQMMDGGNGVGTIVLLDDGRIYRLAWMSGRGPAWVQVPLPPLPAAINPSQITGEAA